MKPLLGTLLLGLLAAIISVPVWAQPADLANDRAIKAQTDKVDTRASKTPENIAEHVESIKQQTEERREEIKQRVEERKIELDKNVCERRITSLKRTMPRISQGAESVKNTLDTMYERVQGFYENGQLTVQNYDELTASIDSAKYDSEAALALIEDAAFNPDCENEQTGDQLDYYRLTVKEAKEELKAYRTVLVQLINSLQAEVATEENESISDEVDNEQG